MFGCYDDTNTHTYTNTQAHTLCLIDYLSVVLHKNEKYTNETIKEKLK